MEKRQKTTTTVTTSTTAESGGAARTTVTATQSGMSIGFGAGRWEFTAASLEAREHAELPTDRLVQAPLDGLEPVVVVSCGSFSPPTLMHLRILEATTHSQYPEAFLKGKWQSAKYFYMRELTRTQKWADTLRVNDQSAAEMRDAWF